MTLDDAVGDANRAVLQALGQLWLVGVSLDWRWVDAAERMLGSQRIALPGTALHRSAIGSRPYGLPRLFRHRRTPYPAPQNPISSLR